MRTIIWLFGLLPMLCYSQHTIEGVLSPPEDYSYVFLYKSSPLETTFVKRSEVDSLGAFKLEMDATAAPGMYKLVYAMPPELYNFDLIFNGRENITLTYNDSLGVDFQQSEENKLWNSYNHSLEMINTTISNFYTVNGKDGEAFRDIIKAQRDFQTAYEENSKDLLVNKLIKAQKPYIPPTYEDISTYASNLKETFLDNVDFNDEFLRSSDFLEDKVMAFVFGLSTDSTSTFYKSQLTKLETHISQLKPEEKLSIMLPIFRRFSEYGNDEMGVYMVDEYLLGYSKQGREELVEYFTSYRNNAVGSQAKNFLVLKNPDKYLYDLSRSDNYLLVFWSSGCSHCLEEMPILKELMEQHPDIKVIAFGIEDEGSNWEDSIQDYPDFIHLKGENRWEDETVKLYDVQATPSYFLLDKDKVIIAKPNDVHNLSDILSKE